MWGKTLHLSDKSRVFCISSPGKVNATEQRYPGIYSLCTQKGWHLETIDPLGYVFTNHQLGLSKSWKEEGEGVKRYEDAPRYKEALGGSGFWKGSEGDAVSMNILDLLLVSV